MGKASSISSQASSVASSISSQFSASASSASKLAASSSSSLSKLAASSSSSLSAEASKSSYTASLSAASASASAAGKNPTIATTSTSTLTTVAIAFTAIIGALIALHFSGALDPVYKFVAEKFFKAEAKAELIALEKTGSKQAEDMLKERLKNNPAASLGESELDEVAHGKGLGDKLGKVGGLGSMAEKFGH